MQPHSVYIHIPFCVRKCAYCDFLSFPDRLSAKEAYVDALCKEIRLTPSFFGKNEDYVETVYLGGGTPSLLSVEDLAKILQSLSETFRLSVDCEITLEANPGTVDDGKLLAFRKAGVNRLSLGIQSLSDPVLTTLGRIHDAFQAERTIEAAQSAGFTNLSCDMMLGIPGQTMEDVERTLSFFLQRKIPHISLYSLILEEGTPMYDRYGGDIERYVSQEADREMYHYVVSTLQEQGYSHYEISNMALPGFESRHNLMYWRAEPYYAYGCGAHYYLGEERGRHEQTPEAYIAALQVPDPEKERIYIPEEKLTLEDRKKEFMMLAFRTGRGVVGAEFERRFEMTVESAFAKELEQERNAGLVEKYEDGYRLTEKGFDLANQVFGDYV